jgi:hypothetical protein
MKQIRVSIDKLPEIVAALVEGSLKFAELV